MANQYDIADQIMRELQRFSSEAVWRINLSAESCAKELRGELKATSPKKTGRYAKGWAVKKADTSKYALARVVVYNRTDYQLTHLLEYGHAIKGGTERVKAHPHIAAAQQKAAESFARAVEKDIEEAGK